MLGHANAECCFARNECCCRPRVRGDDSRSLTRRLCAASTKIRFNCQTARRTRAPIRSRNSTGAGSAFLFSLRTKARGDGALSSATISSRLAACRVFSLERHARHPALHRGAHGDPRITIQLRAGFPGTRLSPVPVQQAPCRTVVVPSDSMPGAARGWGYEPQTQASAPCSVFPSVPRRRPRMSKVFLLYIPIGLKSRQFEAARRVG